MIRSYVHVDNRVRLNERQKIKSNVNYFIDFVFKEKLMKWMWLCEKKRLWRKVWDTDLETFNRNQQRAMA